MKEESEIEINLNSLKKGLKICIRPKLKGTLFDGVDSVIDNNEPRFQLIEGCFYDYAISDDNFILGDVGSNIVYRHQLKQNIGTISPNTFVGTLEIPVFRTDERKRFTSISFEVQSVKLEYLEDYGEMLEFITEKCADYLLEFDPVLHHFDLEIPKDSQKLYQMFSFIQSIISSTEYTGAIHKILTAPIAKWSQVYEPKDLRSSRKFSNRNLKELVRGGERLKVPSGHHLRDFGLETISKRITSVQKIDSVDTPENRFVIYALHTFLKVFSDINSKAAKDSKLHSESGILINKVESQLNQFNCSKISKPESLKLNSPMLQRKEGYNEVLRTWFRFELAVKLIWEGGEDVYGAGKKDIAVLYEYWLFFKLAELFEEIFEIEPQYLSTLFEKSGRSMNLKIKQRRFTALKGVAASKTRKMNFQFNYNRTFNCQKDNSYSESWTTMLRPNYTLSFWPFGISESEAEKQELIWHVHFESKYKIAEISDAVNQDENHLGEKKIENRRGIFENIDLIKMHAYKDAIRGTGGVYILYPGHRISSQKEFHEIAPGLGAFCIRPFKNDNGMIALKSFIFEMLNNCAKQARQAEKIAFSSFKTLKAPLKSLTDIL